jgi:hypothetical protein
VNPSAAATKSVSQADEWFVSNGSNRVIGPVSLELIAKGVAHDRVPRGALVRRSDWSGWKPVNEVPELRASEDSGVHKTTVSREVAAIAEAQTIGEAALYVLATAMSQLECDGGLVHLYDPHANAFRTKCANGPYADEVLGQLVALSDLAMLALAHGNVLDEWANAMTVTRLRALGVSTHDTITLPLRAQGEMIGAIELGAPKGRVAFSAADVAFVERVANCLARRVSGGES